MRRGLLVLLLLLVLPSVARATGPQTFPYGGTGSGAPADATYVTQTPDATLTNEQALSALSTGLLLNTTGTGVLSIFGGTSCTAKFPRSLSASGAATCEEVALGTDTSGNYAASSSEGGPATDLACSVSPCVSATEVDATSANTVSKVVVRDASGNFSAGTITATLSGNASTATALAANGANCPAGQAPLGVDAAGAVESCTAYLTAEVDGSTTNELQSLFETIATSSGTSPVADSITDTLTINGTAPVTVTGNATTDTITLSLADVTDCSANQFVTGSGANLSLVCAQPSASNLSNGTTGTGAVVLQSSPTLTTPLIASFANATHDHSSTTQGGLIDHGSLSGRSADGHSQYALLAGRSGGQTLIGGTASGDDLTLQSTSNGTKGSIFLDDAVELWPNVPDFSSTAMTVVGFTQDLDLGGIAGWHSVFRAGPTVHVGQVDSFLGAVTALRGDMTILHDDATSSSLPFVQLFWAPVTMTTSVAVAAPGSYALIDTFTKQGTGAITVPSGGAHYTVRGQPQFKSISGATSTWAEYYGLSIAATVGTDNGASDGTASTVTTMGAVKYTDVAFDAGAGTEAVTNQIAIDIGALSNATTNIGIRNADTTVYTPPSTVTVAAGFTLTATATTQKIDATAARTSSVTTAINDGVADGQEFIIMNVDASGDAITIKTGANTDLSTSAGASGDCVLNQGGVLHVIWSSDRSDWLGISCNSN